MSSDVSSPLSAMSSNGSTNFVIIEGCECFTFGASGDDLCAFLAKRVRKIERDQKLVLKHEDVPPAQTHAQLLHPQHNSTMAFKKGASIRRPLRNCTMRTEGHPGAVGFNDGVGKTDVPQRGSRQVCTREHELALFQSGWENCGAIRERSGARDREQEKAPRRGGAVES